ncbi:MAG: glucose 1-dehydrogenase, partial [Candidatus Latescibacteria bacterium]|nr:glucose 1-dehydrogenase [Candidatus Latescibacterota bacterium]
EGTQVKRFDLERQTALVSGASRGIGRAIALALAEAGADVAVAARSSEDLEALAGDITEMGVRGQAVQLDISATSTIPAAVAKVVDHLGTIDILFNVAGTNVRGAIEEIDEAQYDEVMDVNIKGAYFLCQEVGKGMMAQKRGKVINIASLTTAIGLAKVTVYTSSKGALGQLTKGLAVEWGPHNIQVNAIAPGFILTDLNRKLWENQEMLDWATGRTPAGRLGSPDDIVGTAIYLASGASDFVSGQILFVDGGIMAGSPWPL